MRPPSSGAGVRAVCSGRHATFVRTAGRGRAVLRFDSCVPYAAGCDVWSVSMERCGWRWL